MSSIQPLEPTLPIPTQEGIKHLAKIIRSSVNKFGAKQTFENILKSLGGLPIDFRRAFIKSLSIRSEFNYNMFRDEIFEKYPIFGIFLEIRSAETESGEESFNIPDVIPSVPVESGLERLTSIESITRAFKYVNDLLLVLLHSQEPEVLEQIKETLGRIRDSANQQEDDVEEAGSRSRRGPRKGETSGGAGGSTGTNRQTDASVEDNAPRILEEEEVETDSIELTREDDARLTALRNELAEIEEFLSGLYRDLGRFPGSRELTIQARDMEHARDLVLQEIETLTSGSLTEQ